MTKDDRDWLYCFGNYSDCACNECPAVKECTRELVRRNLETIDGTEHWIHKSPDAADATWLPVTQLDDFELMGFYDDK